MLTWIATVPSVSAEDEKLSLQALREIEQRIQAVVEKVAPATVAIQIGDGTGSGVIVSADGLVLSVAHVTGAPGQRAAVHFADGSVAAAETLGLEGKTDCGMLQMVGPGPWPHAPVASHQNHSEAENEPRGPQPGDFVVALGHPGGYDADRPVVVRVGRVTGVDIGGVEGQDGFGGDLRTDAALIAGDSGGPLLDLDGRVIGIHTRIGSSPSVNFHVPVARYAAQWSALARGGRAAARLGAVGRDTLTGFRVGAVEPDSPAAAAGLTRGDIIVAFNGETLGPGRPLDSFLAPRRDGDAVSLRVRRRGQDMDLTVTLDARPIRWTAPDENQDDS